jgi:CRP-like cAMP-binding protein
VFDVILAASSGLRRTSVAAGSTVITEGEHPDRLLVLESGVVSVSREGVPVATIGQQGAVFGDLSALLAAPATATVRTETPCTFRVSDEPMRFLHDHPELALAIATLLARRLDALTRYLVDVREQYAGREDHLGVVDVVLESLSHEQSTDADPGSEREREAPY